MHLITVEINGFRRLKDVRINLENKLIAVVGPNEAGKTSLLNALSSLQHTEPFERAQLTRGTRLPENHIVVRARFLLSEEEHRWVEDFGAKGKPKWYILNKAVNGKRTHSLEPRVFRDTTQRLNVSARLTKMLDMGLVQTYLDEPVIAADVDEISEEESLRNIIETVLVEIDVGEKDLGDTAIENIERLVANLGRLESEMPKRPARTFEITRNALEELLPVEKRKHPYSLLLDKISEQRPDFLYFSEEDRNLASDYPIDVLSNPPNALKNLFDLADIDLAELQDALKEQNYGAREKIVEQANNRLREVFTEAWNQYNVFIRLQIDSEIIRLLLPSVNTYSDIAERSDGLRSFLALYAFTYLKSGNTKPILLVDEAEAHLHYDAQSDLMKVFETQTSASQIIYTTHSAGCLPHDFGSAVRVIAPELDVDGNDLGVSVIKNSFWDAGPGFSPLLFAMGASVLASTRSRRLVLTEGASDLILLPYLLREVTQRELLDFQIAPGLANASRIELQNLDLEAPRVVYFLDGDDAGKRLAGRLKSLGVPEDKIVRLDEPFTIEDFVEANVYLQAVNEELRRSYGDSYQISSDDFSSPKAIDSVVQWCRQNSISPPPKVKVAYHIVSVASDKSIVNPQRKEILLRIYNEVKDALA
jgi:predicted ATP-dependent endonuclease of OLD family